MRSTFLLSVAFSLPLLSGQPKELERDANGFGNIKWGMTVGEAKADFAGLHETERSELESGGFRERLIQPVFMVGSVEMTVSIQTKADSDRITRVVLKLAPFVAHRATALEFLTNQLVQKYGPPSRQDSVSRGRMKESIKVWTLPSTTITLDWLGKGRNDFHSLDITYEAVDKRALSSHAQQAAHPLPSRRLRIERSSQLFRLGPHAS